MADSINAVEAPVDANELAGVIGITKRAVMKRGDKGAFGPQVQAGRYLYALSNFVDQSLADKVRRSRETVIGEAVEEFHDSHFYGGIIRLEKIKGHYPAEEEAFARQKANFVIAVGEKIKAHPQFTDPKCCRMIVMAAERQVPHPFDLLIAYGESKKNLIDLGDNPNSNSFAAYKNFRNWRKQWKKYHRNDTDDYQFWALCRRYDDGAKQLKDRYAAAFAEGRKGDPRFWTAFRAFYETTARPSYEETYRDICGLAVKQNWTDIPALWQIKYFYEVKVSDAERRAVEGARRGRKHYYDKCSLFIRRDWRESGPDECWSLDNHKMDVFARRWDPDVEGWVEVRPWLTNAVDSSSWFEVGAHFTELPARNSIEMCLRVALMARRRAPKRLYMDNGKDFKSLRVQGLGFDEDRLVDIVDGLNIEYVAALPFNARVKVNERDYRIVIEWFSKLQPTYCGSNEEHFKVRYQELERGILAKDSAGRLLHWEKIPTVAELEAKYRHWRETVRHARPVRGKILCGKTPAQKYLSVTPQRLVTDDEIHLAFLKVVGEQTVPKNADVWYQPPGTKEDARKYYQDEALMGFQGRKVMVKYDGPSKLVFAFEHTRLGLKLIKCAGPFGSVPQEFMPHEREESTEEFQAHVRRLNRMQKRKSEGQKAARHLAAWKEEAAQISRENPGVTPEQALVYVVKPEEAGKRIEAIKAREAELERERQELDAVLKKARPDLDAAFNGKTEKVPF